MKFQTFDEAEKSVKHINDELRFMARFGEILFPAKCFVRCQSKRGTHVFSLSSFLGTVACAVPTGTFVSYLNPTSQLGRQALTIIASMYPFLEARKKEEGEPNLNGSLPPLKKSRKK